MDEIRFTQADMKLLLESLIEHQHKLYDRSYLCRDGERREKAIVQIAETEELIKKVHDKVMKEYDRIQEARRLAEKAAATKREREKKKNFEKVVGKWLKKKLRKNGLVVSVPEDLKIVHRQAKILHQCLESCDYIGKMAEKRCLLVFIATREGAPVATAEILPNGKIGQFYGDELSRDAEKMKPGKKAREALDAWIDKFKPRWRKAA